MKTMMRKLAMLDTSRRAPIEAQIPQADRELIRDSSPLWWLPLHINVRATEAIWTGLDAETRETFFRDLMLADFQSSLLKPLATSAVKIFGMNPASFVKWTPRGWPLLFRACGQIVVLDSEPGRARLAFEGFPEELSFVWFQSCRASLSAYLDLANVRGDVTLEDAGPGARRRVLRFRWTPQH
jgi:hypothetical protein